jgi:glycosyltransferase involved in cell wall biosynthesis
MVGTVWWLRGSYTVAHIDVFSGPAFLWAELVCWTLARVRRPFVLTLHGGDLPDFAVRWPQRVGRLLSSAAAVIAPSGYLKEKLKSYRPDIRVVPNALDTAKYPYRMRAQPRARLIWLRAFHEIYDPSVVPRVAVELIREYPTLQIVMVGPDKGDGSFERTQRIAAELGVSRCIDFVGSVPKKDVPAWLRDWDIFLNTSRVDNTPVTVLEAMACGLCVVSSSVGGVPYLLEEGMDALLVPPRDPTAMAGAVRRILSEPGLAARLSCHARQKAETFDWSMTLEKWDRILSSCSRTSHWGLAEVALHESDDEAH